MQISAIHGGERVPGPKVNGNKGIRREWRNVKRQEAIQRQFKNVDRGYSIKDANTIALPMRVDPASLDEF